MPPKKRKPRTKKPKVTLVKSERQKQAVNVNVRIDQSKRTRSGGGGGGGRVVRQPTNIINFPANSGVSEIRYNPEIRYLPAPASAPVSAPTPAPLGMMEPAKINENILANVEPPKIYRNPNRDIVVESAPTVSALTDYFPDASVPEPTLLGAVSSVGSTLLSEAYPEYSDVFELASQFSQSNIAKKGASRISRLAGDAWDSLVSQRTIPRTVVTSAPSVKAPSVAKSSVYSSNVYDWLGYDSAMDNSTIPTQNTLINNPKSISTRSTLPVPSLPDYTEQTLIPQMTPPKKEPAPLVSDEEPPFVAGGVAGRVMAIESKIRKPKEQSEYDRWRSENKGRYSRAEQGSAWAREKELRKKKKGG